MSDGGRGLGSRVRGSVCASRSSDLESKRRRKSLSRIDEPRSYGWEKT